MRMNKLLISLLAALFFIFTFYSGCRYLKPKDCCKLPAPSNFTPTVTGPTSATLKWDSVANAVDYLVSVKDATANSGTSVTTTSATTLNLTGLFPGHNYVSSVQARCGKGDCNTSSNLSITHFRTEGIIIQDVTVMFPPGGLHDCNCSSNAISSGTINASNASSTRSLSNAGLTTYGDRIVYLITIRNGTIIQKQFKFGLDYGCSKIFVNRFCDKSDVNTKIVGNTIECDLGLNKLLDLTIGFNPNSNGGSLSVSNLNNGIELDYVRCGNTWQGENCQ